MKERYPSPLEDPSTMKPPLPTPLPPSEIAIEAEVLEPLPGEGNMVWGSWSPDSAYFLLGQRDYTGKVTGSFLNGQTGALCAAVGAYSFGPLTANLRQHHAWLPGGQLLLIDDQGQVVLQTPCAPGAQDATPESGELLTEILDYAGVEGRILFESANEFWIFDGQTLTWKPMPGVTPNPYEAHWDSAAWQPGWEQLAIARLNGRDARDGSTLCIIAGDTGELLRTLPQAAATKQHAPLVDWLSPQELLLSSSTGMIDVYDEDSHLLLLLPDGEMEHWTKPEREPTYQDEFVLVDLSSGRVYPPLAIAGHTPRDYPLLNIVYLAASGRLAVSSSQGISLHTLPEGEMTTFWRLAGQGFAPSLHPAPDGSALVAIRDQGGVYWMPLH
jgi:hypothetical protein